MRLVQTKESNVYNSRVQFKQGEAGVEVSNAEDLNAFLEKISSLGALKSHHWLALPRRASTYSNTLQYVVTGKVNSRIPEP